MSPTADELAALAAKYEALVALRAHRDTGANDSAKSALRALAQRHPGSLRELDTLGLPELRRRAAAAQAASAGGPREPWMSWILAFHRLLAAALLVKQARGDDAEIARANAIAGEPLPPATIAAFTRPPGGRLVPLVLDALARRFDRPREEIAEALFPTRRRR